MLRSSGDEMMEELQFISTSMSLVAMFYDCPPLDNCIVFDTKLRVMNSTEKYAAFILFAIIYSNLKLLILIISDTRFLIFFAYTVTCNHMY